MQLRNPVYTLYTETTNIKDNGSNIASSVLMDVFRKNYDSLKTSVLKCIVNAWGKTRTKKNRASVTT